VTPKVRLTRTIAGAAAAALAVTLLIVPTNQPPASAGFDRFNQSAQPHISLSGQVVEVADNTPNGERFYLVVDNGPTVAVAAADQNLTSGEQITAELVLSNQLLASLDQTGKTKLIATWNGQQQVDTITVTRKTKH
jgi:hypothetical protein